MAPYPRDTEPASWHRYFAIESNNRAWDLAERPARTHEDTLAMLNAAHAAALHWNVVGDELNRMRATTLLALTHVLAGFGESARRLADEVRTYFLSNGADAWELALVHSIHAHAAASVGDAAAHRESYEAAERTLALIQDPGERQVVLATFARVPRP